MTMAKIEMAIRSSRRVKPRLLFKRKTLFILSNYNSNVLVKWQKLFNHEEREGHEEKKNKKSVC